MVLFAAIYHWYPLMTGRMFNDTLGKLTSGLLSWAPTPSICPCTTSASRCAPPLLCHGDTDFIPESAQTLNASITISALIVGCSATCLPLQYIWSLRYGEKAGTQSHGVPPRSSGKHQTCLRITAIGATSCHRFIAGPMISAYPAPRKTSFPRTTR